MTTKQERVAFRRRWRRRMAEPADDARCFGTGKVRYRSEEEARSEADRIATSGPALFVYWCQFCHGPHLTKQRPRRHLAKHGAARMAEIGVGER